MNTLNRIIRTGTASLALMLLTQIAGAQSIWVGVNGTSANTNWSSGANWSPSGVPGLSTNVRFLDTGATGLSVGTINNVLDSSLTVTSLKYNNTNGNHTTLIAPGQTLTLAGGLTVGTETDNGS